MTAPDPCPHCGRTEGDPSQRVVRRVRGVLDQFDVDIDTARAALRNGLQGALFGNDDDEEGPDNG